MQCNIFLSTDEADRIREAAQRMRETVRNGNLDTEDGPGEGWVVYYKLCIIYCWFYYIFAYLCFAFIDNTYLCMINNQFKFVI